MNERRRALPSFETPAFGGLLRMRFIVCCSHLFTNKHEPHPEELPQRLGGGVSKDGSIRTLYHPLYGTCSLAVADWAGQTATYWSPCSWIR
jgi:hypothetical protein